MLSNEMINKMQKYNQLRSQADDLQHEIESYLDDKHGISTLVDDDLYGMDGHCPMYEWGTDYFNIKMIRAIIDFKERFNERVGEDPDDLEIEEHFRKQNG